MKAKTRPSSFPFLLLCCAAVVMMVSLVPLPTSSAYGKTRPEVQMGDPTDTDPGPAPSTTSLKAPHLQLVRTHQVGREATPPSWRTIPGLIGTWLQFAWFWYF